MTGDLRFTAPTTVETAVAALAPDGAVALGGGTSLTVLLKNRLMDAECLVFLGRIPELSGIHARPDGGIGLGATTTLRELSRSPLLRSSAPALAQAAGHVGNPRVRAVATVGGGVVHADPRQDLPPVLLALDARVRLVGPSGRREVPLAEFHLGFLETAADEDELVTEVVMPASGHLRTGYSRFTPASQDDYPTVGVAVALACAPDGTVTQARIALGGVGATAILAEEAGHVLAGRRPSPELVAEAAAAAAAVTDPFDDQRGSASYKRAMAEVWTRRTIVGCLAEEPR